MTRDSAAAGDRGRGILEIRFDNGLTALIEEDRRTPVVAVQAWVRVGSNREPEHVRGWSHGIEHMLFKGTERRGESDFALEVADMGGATNAGTGYETTNYHVTCPAEHLDRAVDVLHDALFHSRFDPSALDAEREVLVHENHMYDDQPSGFGATWKWALELACDVSPYRHPIGGLDENLLTTTRDEITAFWRRAYRPDQTTVVIAGAVDPEEAVATVRRTFGAEPLPEGEPLPDLPAEPFHDAMRYRLERGDLQRVYGKIVLPGLAECDPDHAALAVLQQILTDGRSSRLYRVVQQERQLVSGIGLLSESGPREGLLMVDFETGPAEVSDALTAVGEVLGGLRDSGPESAELERAKIRARRAHVSGQETVQGRASSLGWHHLMGDLDGAFDHPERIAAVKADDVRRVAERLFQPRHASVLLYAPRACEPAPPGSAEEVGALLGASWKDGPRPEADAPAPPPPAGSGRRRAGAADRDEPFEECALPGGLRCYLRRDPALPVISLGLYAAGGVALEGPGRAGLASLAQQVHAKGLDDLDAAALHAAVENRGASLSPFSTRDQSGLLLAGLVEHLDELVPLLGRLAVGPTFPQDELDRERRFALEELQALRDDPFQFAALELRRIFYPDHPYGHPLDGTPESLAALTRDDLVAHHRRLWVSRNLAVVASGDLDRDRFLGLLESALADLPHDRAPALPDLTRPASEPGARRTRLERDIRQSVVLSAWDGPDDPGVDRAALALLQSLLNGQSGRLFSELRNRRSLCYASGMQVSRALGPGMIVGYVLTSPEQETEAAAALVDELKRTAVEPPDAEELDRARNRLLGNMVIALQSNGARVGRCATDVLYGRAPNNLAYYMAEIRALTPAAVRDAAARYLGGEDRIEVVVGPARD